MTALIIPAFIAGLLMVLAPCTLPVIPAYLGFISGVSPDKLKPDASEEDRRYARRKIVINGSLFILGFSVVFVVFGALAGFLGQALAPYRIWLGRIGGALVILFGLFMMGLFKLPFLQQEKRMSLPSWLTPGKSSSSFLIGSAFAFGWTPCVGPVLGSILLLASTSSTALQGAFLLLVFSLGLAIPFIAIAFGFSRATTYIAKIGPYLNWISVIGGLFLIALGLLLITDNFALTIQYGYQLFDFINYEKLLNFL